MKKEASGLLFNNLSPEQRGTTVLLPRTLLSAVRPLPYLNQRRTGLYKPYMLNKENMQ